MDFWGGFVNKNKILKFCGKGALGQLPCKKTYFKKVRWKLYEFKLLWEMHVFALLL